MADKVIRVAGVDCGTNSIRLLIADVAADGMMREVLRSQEITRLGQGVDRTGVISEPALERTLAQCAEYAAQCQAHEAASVRFVATSASRDARNAQAFVEGVQAAFADFGTMPEVISGDEEAALSFAGATAGLSARGLPGPYLVVDLGGGSTEFVRGDGQVEAAVSYDLGSVRLTERLLPSDPPTEVEVTAASRRVEAMLGEVSEVVPFDGLGSLIGLAGTVTTVTAMGLGLSAYERERVHLAELPVATVREQAFALLAMTRAERRALPVMQAGREDVIGAGALIWDRIVERVARDSGIDTVWTSERDILDGITLSAATLARGESV